MKRKIKKYHYVIFGISIVIIVVWVATSSLWYLKALLPLDHHEYDLVIGRGSYRGSETILESIGQYVLGEGDVDNGKHSYFVRSVEAQGNEGHILIGRPYLREQFTISRTLSERGWHVQRMGWLVIAQKGSGEEGLLNVQSVIRSIRTYINSKIKYGFREPRLVVWSDINRTRELSQPYTLLVYSNRGEVEVHISEREKAFKRLSLGEKQTEDRFQNDLQITSSTELLESIPEELIADWEEVVRKMIGIKHAKPEVLKDIIESHDQIFLSVSDYALLGVKGNVEDFVVMVQGWIREEDAYKNPQVSTFQLPDNTIGWEYVPSESEFTLEFHNEGKCAFITITEVNLLLCKEKDSAYLSTGTNRNEGLFSENLNMKAHVGRNFLQPLWDQFSIKHVDVYGNDSDTLFLVKKN